MSQDDIVFDDVKYREPERRRPPDRDRRWACVAYEVPGPGDLPVFLDRRPADAIERHALRDTSVELGGILLGRECVDDETGEPFHVQQRKQIEVFREAWREAGHEVEPRVSVSRSIMPITTDLDRMYFGHEGTSSDQFGQIVVGEHGEAGHRRRGRTVAVEHQLQAVGAGGRRCGRAGTCGSGLRPTQGAVFV